MSDVLDMPRFFANVRRARGGGWSYEIRDRAQRGRVVSEGWSAGAKRDARRAADAWIREHEGGHAE